MPIAAAQGHEAILPRANGLYPSTMTKDVGRSLPIDYEESTLASSWPLLLTLAVIGYLFLGDGYLHRAHVSHFVWSAIHKFLLTSGILVLLKALDALSKRRHLRIDQSMVEVSEKTLFRSSSWHEPLSNYEAVFASRIQYRDNPETKCRLELKHRDDRGKNVELYYSDSETDFRQATHAYAKLFRLPLQERYADNSTSQQDWADVDKSIKMLASEGKLGVEPTPLDHAPEGRIRAMDPFLGIGIEASSSSFHYLPSFAAIAVVTISGTGLWYWSRPGKVPKSIDNPEIWTFLGWSFAVLALIILVLAAFNMTTETLEIKNDKIVYRFRWLKWDLMVKTLPVDCIQTVRRRSDARMPGLSLESETTRINFGANLTAEEINWARQFILWQLQKR